MFIEKEEDLPVRLFFYRNKQGQIDSMLGRSKEDLALPEDFRNWLSEEQYIVIRSNNVVFNMQDWQ